MAGRKVQIDEEQVRFLAQIQCTHEEIAAFFHCSTDTIARRYAETIKEEREVGRSSLRKWQWDSARKGNTTMLIWLGKQYLGQTDKQVIEADVRTTYQEIDPFAEFLRDHPELAEPAISAFAGNGGSG